MLHQIGFYKDLIYITLNIRIKYLQKIHTYIVATIMLRHHIVVPLQLQGNVFSK